MLKGFEIETAPLSPEELVLVPAFVRGFSTKIGKDNAVTAGKIASGLRNQGHNLSHARIQKIIHHIRVNGLVLGLVATSSGYFISEDPKVIEDYLQSLMGRERAIARVREALQSQLNSITNTNQQTNA